jgi:hypothetical protein
MAGMISDGFIACNHAIRLARSCRRWRYIIDELKRVIQA